MNDHEVEVGSATSQAEADALVRQLSELGITARAQSAASTGLLARLMGGSKSSRFVILVPINERRRAAQALRQRRVT